MKQKKINWFNIMLLFIAVISIAVLSYHIINPLVRRNMIKEQLESRYSGYDIKITNVEKVAEDNNGSYYRYDIVVYYENTKTIRNVEINKVEYIEKSK